MGRRDPFPAFRPQPPVQRPSGQVPDFALGGNIYARIEPNRAWRETHAALTAEAKGRGDETPVHLPMTDSDQDVVMGINLLWLIPVQTAPTSPQVALPFVELSRRPLLEVKHGVRSELQRAGLNGFLDRVPIVESALG